MERDTLNKFVYERYKSTVDTCLDASKRGRCLVAGMAEPTSSKSDNESKLRDILHYKCYADMTKRVFGKLELDLVQDKDIFNQALEDYDIVRNERFSYILALFLHSLAGENTEKCQSLLNTITDEVIQEWKDTKLLKNLNREPNN
jgi:hypothetical protein